MQVLTLSLEAMRTLDLLAGCPDGATEAALALHQISPETLDDLVEKDLIEPMTQVVVTGRMRGQPPIKFTRFFLTDAGRYVVKPPHGAA
jgi:hypothetical protein